ncbi:MAG: hypothetical protein M0Z30_07680 [Actinomycetota bacterium]|nr:hypothetical protein [Actinomycetota bacterium]
MQLRLGLDSETEVVEVWATLETEHRAVVIERLAALMANAVAPAGLVREEEPDEAIESGEGAGDVTRVA